MVTHRRIAATAARCAAASRRRRKEFVFYTDGDGQYDVSELPRLLALAGPDTGLVNGYKLERHDPAHRIWIGSIYNFCARLLFRIRIRDIDCDYRLIRRALLEQIQLTSTSGTICVELVRKLELSGCEVKEVGVHHYERKHGRSQFFRIRSLAKTFIQLAAILGAAGDPAMSVPMVNLRPLLAQTQPAWRPTWTACSSGCNSSSASRWRLSRRNWPPPGRRNSRLRWGPAPRPSSCRYARRA